MSGNSLACSFPGTFPDTSVITSQPSSGKCNILLSKMSLAFGFAKTIYHPCRHWWECSYHPSPISVVVLMTLMLSWEQNNKCENPKEINMASDKASGYLYTKAVIQQTTTSMMIATCRRWAFVTSLPLIWGTGRVVTAWRSFGCWRLMPMIFII